MTKGAGSKLWGWDSVTGTWVKILVNSDGKLIIDPSEIFENPPTNGETAKAAQSDWSYDHAANPAAHHAKYTDAEAAAVSAALITIHTAIATAHQDAPALIATHTANPAAHHAKYTDAEAKAQAEGAKLDAHAAPDDTTTRDATAALHGLMPKASVTKLADIAALADVTGDNAPQAHAASHDFLGSDEGSFHQGLLMGSRLFLFDGTGHDDVTLWTKNTNGTGSITPGIMNTLLATGATNGSDATFRTTAAGWGVSSRYIKWNLIGIDQADCDIWIWISKTDGAQAPVNTEQYAGFLTTNGRLWCYSSDGAVNEATDTGLDDVDGAFVIRITDGKVYFWLDGVLLATHETRVPSSSNHYVKCRIDNTAAANKSCRLVNICHA